MNRPSFKGASHKLRGTEDEDDARRRGGDGAQPNADHIA
jgi:hypothetical protein